MSNSKVTAGHATAWIERDLPLQAGHSITYSSVMGVTRPGQLRRDFLAYVERERAHPYRTFLHYNSWYDLGYFTPYDEAGALDRINAFGRELSEKRGVKLDSLLFDDGWDNHHSLWQFNGGFPGRLYARCATRRRNISAGPGVWMSPWGGYSTPQKERLAYGKARAMRLSTAAMRCRDRSTTMRFRDVVPGDGEAVWRQPVQVRWDRECELGVQGQPFRQRLRRDDPSDRARFAR